MSENAQSLWPDVIRAKVQSPHSILAAQAEALTRQTNGVLVGNVGLGSSEDDDTVLSFNIVVPELDNYRHRILMVQHGKDMHYPAAIDAEVFRPRGLAGLQAAMSGLVGGEGKKPANRADSDKELIELVAKVLRSPYVVSVAQSLIARAEDARTGKLVGAKPPALAGDVAPASADGDSSSDEN